jgi:hypothetical protein
VNIERGLDRLAMSAIDFGARAIRGAYFPWHSSTRGKVTALRVYCAGGATVEFAFQWKSELDVYKELNKSATSGNGYLG